MKRSRDREVAKIVSILLILPQLAETEMQSKSLHAAFLESICCCQYKKRKKERKAARIKGKMTKICSSSVERLQS